MFDRFGEVLALRDVSFAAKRGDAVGIIGRNSAGKSALLKILSRITRPTGGRAEIRGRVGSLLEVGTGFHPRFTARKDIYLNGAILGMLRKDIDIVTGKPEFELLNASWRGGACCQLGER